MRRLFLTHYLLISSFLFGAAQNSPIQNILEGNIPIPYISKETTPLFVPQDKAFTTHPQQLLQNGQELYLFIHGTGRLYKVTKSANEFIFIREDSSTHFGYNHGAFTFSYQNNIYSIGGYGIWRINGQLRIFNTKDKQWDIVRLNEEVPFLFDEINNILWYDSKQGKIYLGYAMYRNEAVGGKELDDTKLDFITRVLDLKKLQWQNLGRLNKILSSKIQMLRTIGMSPWGQLVLVGDKLNLIDFKNNQILMLKESTPSYQTILRNRLKTTFYFKDSLLYFGANQNKTLDSILLKYVDFEKKGEPVYEPLEGTGFLRHFWLYILIVILSIFSFYWLFKNYKFTFSSKRKQLLQDNLTFKQVNTLNITPIFEEQEKQILLLLISNSQMGQFTNIDEINKTMGITKRSIEIQKKQRSDTIISINKKYAFVYPEEAAIILKQRSEFDKRSFEYFIEFQNLTKINQLISN